MFKEIIFKEDAINKPEKGRLPTSIAVLCGVTILALCTLLVGALISTQRHSEGLQQVVSSMLNKSGVENPVTAVLLNFRSYDTLLEIAVLLIVAIVMLPQATVSKSLSLIRVQQSADPGLIMSSLLRFLAPTLIIMGGYMLWTGAYSPGGAFQAGALIAGAGILIFTNVQYQVNMQSFAFRALLSIGLCIFILSGFAVALQTGQFLEYPQKYASAIILFIETAATVSIATTLLLLYLAVAGTQEEFNHDA
ncbi:hydrogen gas-evolving membrane-bound hydrogenase subunit E [Brumicola pallidula]|jgi:multisubunit Na+/H+ antiporter MnhB subunit|uniref:hydrogen gas-evolving membrane-bound hydrogenase subunit E n=1 Tax=Brumicola pallidula TaxID=56807 RepID=UPI0002DB0E3E|nr:hydrogen gas-evolving membrane-bound hydrogenase subunit E [Glaciecola pallidula]